jgi:tetratricopeptide (TPR) repeat protein
MSGACRGGHRRRAAAFLCAAFLLPGVAGCALWGQPGATVERIESCHALTRQAISAIEMGQWQPAEMLLHEAIATGPNDAEARRWMAEVLWHRGAVSQAMGHIAAAVRARPADAALAVRAGEMALAMQERDAALALAETAIRLDPQLAAAWALRGRVFWQLRQGDRALADLGRALEFAPNSRDVLLDLAVIYRERGQPARCLTTLHHLQDTCPAGEQPQSASVLEGLALLDLQRPRQACDALLAASRRGPQNAQTLYYLAHAQYASGRIGEATAAAQQALAIDASHQPSRELLAQLAANASSAEPQRR